MLIEKNYTKYPTEDLERLLRAVEAMVQHTQRHMSFMRRLRNHAPGWTLEENTITQVGRTRIRVPTPEIVYRHFPAESLALGDRVPFDALVELFAAPLAVSLDRGMPSRPGSMAALREALRSAGVILPILPRAVDKRPVRKLSQGERVARLLELYGPGGVIPPKTGYTWTWERSLGDMQEKYEVERARRRAYVPKLAKLGVRVQPYETWPELLRRLADKIEGKS